MHAHSICGARPYKQILDVWFYTVSIWHLFSGASLTEEPDISHGCRKHAPIPSLKCFSNKLNLKMCSNLNITPYRVRFLKIF